MIDIDLSPERLYSGNHQNRIDRGKEQNRAEKSTLPPQQARAHEGVVFAAEAGGVGRILAKLTRLIR